MPNYKVGTPIMPFGKSAHSGHPGIVVADYGSHLLVKSTEKSYSAAGSNSIGEGSYFQVDSLLVKQTGEPDD